MTPFAKHRLKWQNCTRCDLCKTRDKVCLVRGKLPADVLLIGEAPGPSEDVIGSPFIGPAGHLLDRIVEQAGGANFRLAWTNLVACIPKNEDTGSKFAEPPDYAIKECAPRLIEITRIAKPRLIVQVGKLAKQAIMGQADLYAEGEDWLPWLPKSKFLDFCEIVHPAWILRLQGEQVARKSLEIKRCIATLSDAFSRL